MEDNFDSVQWRDDDEDSVDDFAHHASSSVKSPVGGANGGSSSSSTEHQHHQQLSPGLQAGPNADALDLAGVGRGVLETFVSDPQTEGEGTKDAYVSYRVTTKVYLPVCGVSWLCAYFGKLIWCGHADRFSDVPKTAC